MKIIFTGGGTAGHIYPALAIAKELNNAEYLFIGRESGMEAKKVPENGFSIKFVEIKGIDRKNIFKNFSLPFIWLKAIKDAKKIISEFKPDIVIGTGGYVAAPVVYAAAKLGIKTMIHEVNSIPGITTKFLSKYADIITVSFDETKKIFKNAVVTGNPIRQEIFNLSKETARKKLSVDDKPLIVAFGGSLGAKAINDAMKDFVPKNKDKYNFIWGCGERYFDEYKSYGATPYINNMNEVLPAADLIITRGGGTLFELTALGKASIIIPSPNVAANHQEKNARAMEKEEALYVLLENEIENLPKLIEKALENQTSLEKSAKKIGKPDATKKIIKLLINS